MSDKLRVYFGYGGAGHLIVQLGAGQHQGGMEAVRLKQSPVYQATYAKVQYAVAELGGKEEPHGSMMFFFPPMRDIVDTANRMLKINERLEAAFKDDPNVEYTRGGQAEAAARAK